MTGPTIASRLRRRCIVMSGDAALVTCLRSVLPSDWELEQTGDLSALGDYDEILQYRFLLLDLDEREAFDPLDTVRAVRTELMLNLPIFCFGGTAEIRDKARLARADRFFERGEVAARLGQFCDQFGW